MSEHWGWLALVAACLVWYSVVTVYVAIKGATDIRNMLQTLSARKPKEES